MFDFAFFLPLYLRQSFLFHMHKNLFKYLICFLLPLSSRQFFTFHIDKKFFSQMFEFGRLNLFFLCTKQIELQFSKKPWKLCGPRVIQFRGSFRQRRWFLLDMVDQFIPLESMNVLFAPQWLFYETLIGLLLGVFCSWRLNNCEDGRERREPATWEDNVLLLLFSPGLVLFFCTCFCFVGYLKAKGLPSGVFLGFFQCQREVQSPERSPADVQQVHIQHRQ